MQSLFEGVNVDSLDGISKLIGNAIQLASVAAGAVAVIFIIVGAIQYASSGGGDGVAKAKKTISMAIGGLVLALGAYGFVTFINSSL